MDFLVDCPHEASPISNVFSPNMENNKIHVMLVEHDGKHQDTIKNILHYFSYEVTTVKLATTASSMLLTGNARYDLVMASMNSSSSDMMSVFQLVRDAVTMNLLVVLMSNNDIDAVTTMRALEEGAFLCIEKPVTMQIMECLWQHVVREKASAREAAKRIQEAAIEYNALHKEDEGNKNINGCNIIVKGNTKSIKKKMTSQQHGGNNIVAFKKKVWTQWTDELHGKFMQAVTQLGEGRCYPKEILQLMNVSGLTRMQVASHLQICRSSNWRTPGGKKPKQAINVKATPPHRIRKKRAPRGEIARFGSMPRPGTELLKYHRRQLMINNNNATTKRIIEDDNVGYNSYGRQLPAVFEDGNQNHPFAAAAHHNDQDIINSCHEMLNVGQFIQTFDEPPFAENVIIPDVTDNPQLIHNLFPLQHDLGVINYNILFDQLNHDLIHTMTTNATKQWTQDVPK